MFRRTIAIAAFLLAALLSGCGGSTSASSEPATGAQAQAPGEELGLPNERAPAEGLRTGGQPDERALERAEARGYTTVISLRTEGEPGSEGERQTVERLGMELVSIPVAGAAGLTEQNARALAEALERAQGPVVLHCGSGNRAGALLALRAYFVDGESLDEALEVGRAAGMTSLEDAVRERIVEHCDSHPDRSC